MRLPDNATIDIGGFAAIINSRLAAESRVASAIAFGWLCGGSAIALLLTAIGVASAFWGYSHLISVKGAADETARALVKALESAELKANVMGTMALAPNAEVRLSAGQTIKIEDGAIVKLDPNSSIRVVGDLKLDIPQPSKQQLQLDATTKGNELPLTDYTIFRAVSYGSGEVVTGWNYGLSDTIRPRAQYCYYSQNLEKGLAAKFTLAFNGSPRRPSPLAKVSFNYDAALANCIWYSGD
jgi:hypothetical protein